MARAPLGEWRSLPALQRTVDAPPSACHLDTFGDSLSTHQDPRFLEPLGHDVDAGAPAGEVAELARPVAPSTTEFPFRPRHPAPAPDPAPAVQRSTAVPPDPPDQTLRAGPAARPAAGPAEGPPVRPTTAPSPPHPLPVSRAAIEPPPEPATGPTSGPAEPVGWLAADHASAVLPVEPLEPLEPVEPVEPVEPGSASDRGSRLEPAAGAQVGTTAVDPDPPEIAPTLGGAGSPTQAPATPPTAAPDPAPPRTVPVQRTAGPGASPATPGAPLSSPAPAPTGPTAREPGTAPVVARSSVGSPVARPAAGLPEPMVRPVPASPLSVAAPMPAVQRSAAAEAGVDRRPASDEPDAAEPAAPVMAPTVVEVLGERPITTRRAADPGPSTPPEAASTPAQRIASSGAPIPERLPLRDRETVRVQRDGASPAPPTASPPDPARSATLPPPTLLWPPIPSASAPAPASPPSDAVATPTPAPSARPVPAPPLDLQAFPASAPTGAPPAAPPAVQRAVPLAPPALPEPRRSREATLLETGLTSGSPAFHPAPSASLPAPGPAPSGTTTVSRSLAADVPRAVSSSRLPTPQVQRTTAVVGPEPASAPRTYDAAPDPAPAPRTVPAPAPDVVRALPLQRIFSAAPQEDRSGGTAESADPAAPSWPPAGGSALPAGTATTTVVQRIEDGDTGGGAEPAATGVATSLGAAPAAPGAKGGTDVDELARRLYAPLSAMLRAELWLDRERSGRSLAR